MANHLTRFTVGFDDETVELLLDLAAEAGCEPRQLIAAIVRDVLVDDALSHCCACECVPPRHQLN